MCFGMFLFLFDWGEVKCGQCVTEFVVSFLVFVLFGRIEFVFRTVDQTFNTHLEHNIYIDPHIYTNTLRNIKGNVEIYLVGMSLAF